MQNILQYAYVEIGYNTRGQTYNTILGIAGTIWSSGGYDPVRKIFTSPAFFNVGVAGVTD